MNTVRNLTARQRRHFIDVVNSAASSLKQVEIARAAGVSASTVSRVLATREAAEAIEAARARALANSWIAFSELLDTAISVLRTTLESPLTGRELKARVALRLLEAGMSLGAIGATPTPAPPVAVPVGAPMAGAEAVAVEPVAVVAEAASGSDDDRQEAEKWNSQLVPHGGAYDDEREETVRSPGAY